MSVFNFKKMLKPGLVVGLLAWTCASASATDLNFTPNFGLDQQAPKAAFGQNGGVVIWQDLQSTTGDFSIKGLRLDPNLVVESGVFYVSDSSSKGIQENAQVASLPEGGFAYVWQGGEDARQSIHLRIQGEDNVFVTPSISVTGIPGYHSKPNIAVGDTKLLVVWETFSANDESQHDVFGQFYHLDGQSISPAFLLSRKIAGGQNNPVAAHVGGDQFSVVWVDQASNPKTDESSPAQHSVRLVAKTITNASDALLTDNYITSSSIIAANPSISSTGQGSFDVAFSAKDLSLDDPTWEIYTVSADSQTLSSLVSLVAKSSDSEDQLAPSISSSNGVTSVTWMEKKKSTGQFDIFLSHLNGQPVEIVNTTTFAHQMYPNISSVGNGSSLILWTGFNSLAAGFDIFGKIVEPATTSKLAAPIVFSYPLSTSSIIGTIQIPINVTSSEYEVEITKNGETSILSQNSSHFEISGLAPATSVNLRVRYKSDQGVLSDWSNSIEARSWEADANFDGLPDDWQKEYFGTDLSALDKQTISAFFDYDSDGASNLSEFLSGTDPTDPDSILKVSISLAGENLSVSWNTIAGRVYVLEGSSDLKSWNRIGSPRIATSNQDALVINGLEQATYFRVIKTR